MPLASSSHSDSKDLCSKTLYSDSLPSKIKSTLIAIAILCTLALLSVLQESEAVETTTIAKGS